MCGIVACRTRTDCSPYLLAGLGALEYRGYDSAGVAIRTTDAGLVRVRSTDRVGGLALAVGAQDGAPLSGTGIGHTRWATQGAVTESNAHPHVDCTGRLAVVHNGIVDNAALLRVELIAEGHAFSSEVDSEVIVHLVEDALHTGLDLVDAVRAGLARLTGSWALVVLDVLTGRLVGASHRAPLLVASSEHGAFFASDVAALTPWIDTFRPLEDGEVVELDASPSSSPEGGPVAGPPRAHAVLRRDHVEHDLALGDRMGHEIDEQPEVAAGVIDRLASSSASGRLWQGLDLPGFSRVAVLGCGTSLNAGAVIASAFARLGGVPVQTIVGSEAASAVVEDGTLVLALSQSGETADVLAALDQPALRGRPVLALTNTMHSSLARRADAVLDCSAGPEFGVASTKTFVAQVLTGVMLVISALVSSGRLEDAEAAHLVDDLRTAPADLERALVVSKLVVPSLAASLAPAPGFLFLGRGPGVVYAAEGALKLKELTYRWAEAYPAGELKHGPLALVEQGTPVVVVVQHADARTLASISEVSARGGRVVTVGSTGTLVPVLPTPDGRPDGRPDGSSDVGPCGPLASVVALQVLAREIALTLGRDVDKPRNLAKSVTVE